MTSFTRLFVSSLLALAAAPAGVAHATDDPVPPPESAAAAIASLHLPAPTQLRLSNGLTVVLEENHRAPFVSMHLRYASGSKDDPPGLEGVAALTERIAMRRTKHVADGMVERWLERAGASDQGWHVTPDATTEWVDAPTNAVPLVLWLWSDQMGFFPPDATEETLTDARDSLKNARRERQDNAPYGDVRTFAVSALYPPGHPYHALAEEGYGEHVTIADVRTFHDARLVPNRAVLVLVGDFDPAAILAQVRTYFDPIPPRAADPPVHTKARLDASVRIDVGAGVSAPRVVMNWRTPPYFDAGDADLDVMARLLAGSRSSLLHWSLVDQLKIATSVWAAQRSRALGSDFEIGVTVAPGHSPDEVIAWLDQKLNVLLSTRVNDVLLMAARESTVVPQLRELDRPARRAKLYAEYVALRHDADGLATDVARHDVVTLADVQTTAASWLTPSNRVITVVIPDPTAPPGGQLRAAGGGK